MADTDISILSQNRQQGLGNIYAVPYLGGKVFIKSDVGTFEMLKEKYDVKIYDTYEIINENFEEFIKDEYSTSNSNKIVNIFSDEYVIVRWKEIFEN